MLSFLIRKEREMFFSSSSCSLDLRRSLRADSTLENLSIPPLALGPVGWTSFFDPTLKLGLMALSLEALSAACRFCSTSASRLLFSSISLCFFSSISRRRRSSSSFFIMARRLSSSARNTLRLACFSLSFFRSSSSLTILEKTVSSLSLMMAVVGGLFLGLHLLLVRIFFIVRHVEALLATATQTKKE